LLSDTYSAEKQLTRALAKFARATSNEKLSQAFHAHLEETFVGYALINGSAFILDVSILWMTYEHLHLF
ncbi:hypothetical protein Q604_UNBC15057G0001, partial [human gut metagenome]